MSSVNLTINDDGITTDNETAPLVIQTQREPRLRTTYGPRHSISWVEFYSNYLKKHQ